MCGKPDVKRCKPGILSINLPLCSLFKLEFSKPSLIHLISKDANLAFYLSIYRFVHSLNCRSQSHVMSKDANLAFYLSIYRFIHSLNWRSRSLILIDANLAFYLSNYRFVRFLKGTATLMITMF